VASKYDKKYYSAHAPVERARYKRYQERVRDVIRRLKQSTLCQDCGRSYPYYVMDFDHRDPAEKKFNIGIANKGLETMLAEIAKCDIVCANCHRERGHVRRLSRG
jgi:hypothetical protein